MLLRHSQCEQKKLNHTLKKIKEKGKQLKRVELKESDLREILWYQCEIGSAHLIGESWGFIFVDTGITQAWEMEKKGLKLSDKKKNGMRFSCRREEQTEVREREKEERERREREKSGTKGRGKEEREERE